MRSKLHLSVCLLGLGAALLLAGPAHAAFHLMEIEQVIGGVAGDTSAQAVQLKMRSIGQNLLSGTVRLVARDAAGVNPIVLSTLGAGINSGSCDAGGEILLATDAFVNRTTPAAVRDFAMIPIPAGYLPAGSLTFENATGTLVYWRLSWGGAAYTGVGTTTLDNGDGDVNPAVAGPLPSNGLQALRFAAGCPAATSNAAQYAVTPGAAVFENNDQTQFTVTATIANAVPVLPGWGWGALASALALAGAVVARRLRAA
jgi:hypothetical protein